MDLQKSFRIVFVFIWCAVFSACATTPKITLYEDMGPKDFTVAMNNVAEGAFSKSFLYATVYEEKDACNAIFWGTIIVPNTGTKTAGLPVRGKWLQFRFAFSEQAQLYNGESGDVFIFRMRPKAGVQYGASYFTKGSAFKFEFYRMENGKKIPFESAPFLKCDHKSEKKT